MFVARIKVTFYRILYFKKVKIVDKLVILPNQHGMSIPTFGMTVQPLFSLILWLKFNIPPITHISYLVTSIIV